MPLASANVLADNLRDLHLLTTEQIGELNRDLLPRFAEPKALAGELIRRGWLTPYQANLVLQGRGGELLLGSYVLLERIGEGGMGQVFKAQNWKLGRVVHRAGHARHRAAAALPAHPPTHGRVGAGHRSGVGGGLDAVAVA